MSLIPCANVKWEDEMVSFLVGACDSLYEASINNFLKPIRWFYVEALYYITPYHKGENPDKRELIFFKKHNGLHSTQEIKGQSSVTPKALLLFLPPAPNLTGSLSGANLGEQF